MNNKTSASNLIDGFLFIVASLFFHIHDAEN
jgi:hypothetical protein